MRKIILVALLCTGCVQNPAREERIQAATRPFMGQPITTYMAETGTVPTGSFEADGGKVFIFESHYTNIAPAMYAPGTGFYVPQMSGLGTCRTTIRTAGAKNIVRGITSGEGCN